MPKRKSRGVEVPSSKQLLKALIQSLSVVEDPRSARGIRHPLINVLTIAVLGCMCRCDDAEALEDWGHKECDWLSEFLDLPHGPPSQDVYLRVLASIDSESFRTAFHVWMEEVFEHLGLGGQVAIDGQTHRGTRDRAKGSKPLHMVHALACEAGLVLGQIATEEKSNEIKAIPQLLDLLDLRGSLVSIDAMGTQVAIAKKIKAGGGDYLLGLKGNQSTLEREVREAFKEAMDSRSRAADDYPPPTIEIDERVDSGHGRIEIRTAHVLSDFDSWVQSAERWPELRCLVMIKATREDPTSGDSSEETRYYISSRELSPAEANERVRSHWHVENRLHWCLDMTFGQDSSRTRAGNAAENLAVVRHFALNIIRNFKGDRLSVPRRRRLCDYRRDYRMRVLKACADQ